MNGLRTARVVVIDDDQEEAAALLEALGSLGVGALYYTGEESALPADPLDGIRAVFLDIRLAGSSGTEAKDYVPMTLQVLSRVVAPTRGTTGIVYWTKHDDDRTVLESSLPGILPGFEPAFTLSIRRKLEFVRRMRSSGRLAKSIRSALAPLEASNVLREWEQQVHDAATATTDMLLGVAQASTGSDALESKLLKTLGAVAVASGGRSLATREASSQALYEGLNAVQFDRLQQQTRGKGNIKSKALHDQVRGSTTLSVGQMAQLNEALLVCDVGADEPQPGNVYVAKSWKRKGDAFPHLCGKTKKERFLKELWPGQEQEQLVRETLVAASTPCLLEVTPACDHAAGKSPAARLIGGVLLRSPGSRSGEKKMRLPADSRIFAKQTEFMTIENAPKALSGSYSLIANARHLYAMPWKSLKFQTPAFRLRHQVVTDFQSWFAAHAARPGYVGLR